MATSRGQSFNQRLWTMEAESAWKPDDINNPSGGVSVLRRYLLDILNALHEEFSDIDASYAAIAGIVPNVFFPVSSVGREHRNIVPSNQNSPNTLISVILEENEEDLVILISHPKENKYFVGLETITSKIVLKLIGYGELFGFISLDTKRNGGFSENVLDDLKTIQPAISRVLAESVFSLRLWEVALSFSRSRQQQSKQGLLEDIANRALVAFAACGVVIRMFDPATGRLPAIEFAGENVPDGVMDFLIEERSVGEDVAREVFLDTEHYWTVGMLEDRREPFFSGTAISSETEQKLRELGIQAYCVFRLESEVGGSETSKVGTLSFFHMGRRRFSWRDIALAQTLSQRSADLIMLFDQTEKLKETALSLQQANDDLTEANESVLMESRMLTRVEVVSLLAHDLGHKALRVKNAFENFCNDVRKAIRDNLPYNSLTKGISQTDEHITAVVSGLRNVNQLFRGGTENGTVDTIFNLFDAVQDVFKTMKDALDRNNCVYSVNIPKEMELYGRKNILIQVIFNLLINSIEAQRSRKNPRKNRIQVEAAREILGDDSSPIVVKFSDEGPGINRQIFPNPDAIFDLGSSSKSEGTGRGLPISRNLLNAFFSGADMYLQDPERALFHIRFPNRSQE